jgi:uncharacterized protein (TIGR04255 family)
MTEQLPEFDKPPVIETVLGVQFEPIPLTNALAGWYWKSRLEREWGTANETQRVEDVFERFGRERQWRTPQIKLMQQPIPGRLQIVRDDNERMVQVQDTRFVYNWRKSKESTYPTYKTLLPEFNEQFARFSSFVDDESLGNLSINQWEVIYVNHIPKGELWETIGDWPKIFPSVEATVAGRRMDGFTAHFQEELGDQQGRLHTELKFGKKKGADEELIVLQFTARGPVDEKIDVLTGFDLGHSTIVKAFASATSDLAHKHWKRKV